MDDINEFVNRLKLLAPLKEDLKKLNVSDDFVTQFIESYIFIPKISDSPYFDSNIIFSLLKNYDSSCVEIGSIKFLQRIIEEKDFYQFGKFDIDILALNKISLEIEIRDHDEFNHIIWSCASNSANFLEALLVCAEYFTYRVKNYPEPEDNALLLRYVIRSVKVAGGEKYMDFYKTLLGYFD